MFATASLRNQVIAYIGHAYANLCHQSDVSGHYAYLQAIFGLMAQSLSYVPLLLRDLATVWHTCTSDACAQQGSTLVMYNWMQLPMRSHDWVLDYMSDLYLEVNFVGQANRDNRLVYPMKEVHDLTS